MLTLVQFYIVLLERKRFRKLFHYGFVKSCNLINFGFPIKSKQGAIYLFLESKEGNDIIGTGTIVV